jgi:hypothetical protein
MSAAKTNPNMCSAPSLAERRGRRRAEEGKKRYLDVGVGASTQRELRANIHVCLIEMTLWLARDADMHKLKKKSERRPNHCIGRTDETNGEKLQRRD